MNFSGKKNEKRKLHELRVLLSPTRHVKNKVTDFAPSNVALMTKSLFQPIWKDF